MGTRARGAHSAAAAIWAAYLAVGKLQAAAAARLRAFIGSDCDGLEPPRLARRARATFPGQPSHSPTFADFCPDGQCRVRARAGAANRSVQLYYYLKEARETWGGVHIFEGAPLSPRESAVACALLSVCCCARRRTVLAMTFEFGHGLGCSRGLELTIVTGMWGSWRAGFAVRSAGATRVRCV